MFFEQPNIENIKGYLRRMVISRDCLEGSTTRMRSQPRAFSPRNIASSRACLEDSTLLTH